MNTAEQWMKERLSAAPPELLQTMIEALPVRTSVISEALATGALDLYERVVAGEGRREDALLLLAADALFTHAFQARAEEDPLTMIDFAARWGGGGALAGIVP